MTVLDQQPLTMAIPLREDALGVLRVGKSRVLLDLETVNHLLQVSARPSISRLRIDRSNGKRAFD